MSALAQAAKSLLLLEFISAFFLGMRQFFAPKATVNYPPAYAYDTPSGPGDPATSPCLACIKPGSGW